MYRLFNRIDNTLISWTEKFSHWTQRKIGLGTKFWGRTSTVYCATVYSFDVATSGGSSWRWIFFGIMCFIFIIIYKSFDEKKPKLGDVITANIHKERWEFNRLSCIMFLPLEIIASVKDLRPTYGLAYTLALFFLAADDLPYQPSKLRQWIESLTPNTEAEAYE